MLLMKRQGVMGDVRVGGHLGHSVQRYCDVLQLKIRRAKAQLDIHMDHHQGLRRNPCSLLDMRGKHSDKDEEKRLRRLMPCLPL